MQRSKSKRSGPPPDPDSSEGLELLINEITKVSKGIVIPNAQAPPADSPRLDMLIGLEEEKRVIRKKLISVLQTPEISKRAKLPHDNLLLVRAPAICSVMQ